MDTPQRMNAALAVLCSDMQLEFVSGISQVTLLDRLLAGPGSV
jgi:hypothetical protein